MDTAQLIRQLSLPAAYPHPVAAVELHQTHISAVFLAGPYAYKVKKPLDLGFLDFTALARRRHFCEEEVRLNRRLAPEVYLGVVPIVGRGGGLRVGGRGDPVEWAVQMRRLPADRTLLARLAAGEDLLPVLPPLGRHVARFHGRAAAGPEIAASGRWEVVAGNALENYAQAAPLAGRTVSPGVLARLDARTRTVLDALRPLIEERAARQVPRDTHGDLHLDHVYWFPERPDGERFDIVDCIEFNERFRHADPVADLAFLVMDLEFHGRWGWARALADAWFEARGDAQGRELLPFYTAYRAAVRGKVDGFEVAEPEVPGSERGRALASARAHWLLALGLLEPPERRPCLLCVGGLPGTGKSTLARGLGEQAGFTVIASDRVRKELAGLTQETSAPARFGEGIYTVVWNQRTYSECLRRAQQGLLDGHRVLVDASFREEHWRREFLEEAQRLAVPGRLLLCTCGEQEVRRRLGSRRGGPSDADWHVYQAARAAWQSPAAHTAAHTREIRTDGAAGESLVQALGELRRAGLGEAVP
ncbi:MAG: AAA family ATPase [Deferrisomatales bacterium]|nr:AAA family ATPase [Deferrisomatales bacterium]